MSDNVGGFFTIPFVDMALLKDQILAYGTAITNAKLKGLATSSAKVTAKTDLYGTLLSALGYVNNLARLNQVNAVEIIEAAKMLVIGAKSHKKQDFAIKQGVSSGTVELISLAVMFEGKYLKATYYWQYSTDGGITWKDIDDTQVAKTMFSGLTPGVPAKFRKRTNSTKTGMSKWCTPIDFTVQ